MPFFHFSEKVGQLDRDPDLGVDRNQKAVPCDFRPKHWPSVMDPDSDPHQSERQDPDPHQRNKLDPDPDPHPHQSDKLDPDPHEFADDKPKCMENEPI